MKTPETLIQEANQRLKAGRSGVTIWLQPGRTKLYLRGIFPPKPGSERTTPHQQALTLGLPANATGIKVAEGRAREIGGLLTQGKFDWANYLTPEQVVAKETVGHCVTTFEASYFSKRKRTPQTQTTWDGDYWMVYRTLPTEKVLTLDVLTAAALGTEPDTRTRQRFCMALGALARFAGLDPAPLVELRGNYGTDSTLPRELPSDEQVMEAWQNLSHAPAWVRWAYGMMAAYGVRPHELFSLDLEDFLAGSDKVRVTGDTKTGQRVILPLQKEWVTLFQLRQVAPPTRTGKTNQRCGERISEGFKYWSVPFPPYHLRHAWAVRAIRVGLESAVSARMMGHSLTVHNRSYQKWMSEQDLERAYARVVQQ
ncbi:site-specific integrase [Anthocerotibacter panamensis]|uniref:hypothetical protein n=1 Tax=Anthocerotibacter panamensis TaxID=2857077 RepID=UPI001C402671|nr:hypothetical protein [Anthocerotibacter panamensis]